MKELEIWIFEALGMKEKLSWIAEQEKSSSTVEVFTELIRDGTYLCELVNVIRPGTIKNINRVTLFETKQHRLYSFKAMENIWFFLEACRSLGIHTKTDLFLPTDLFEAKNINKVVETLFMFAEQVSAQFPDFQPSFKHVESGTHEFSDLQMNSFADKLERDAKGDSGTFEADEEPEEPTPDINILGDDSIEGHFGKPRSSSLPTPEPGTSSPRRASISGPFDNELDDLSRQQEIDKLFDEVSLQLKNQPKSLSASEDLDANKSLVKRSSLDSGAVKAVNKRLTRRMSRGPSRRMMEEINYSDKRTIISVGKRRWNANEIVNRLFLGDEDSALDADQLAKHNITHILSVVGGKKNHEEREYLILELLDTGEQDILSWIPDCNRFIAEGRVKGGVLVHCQKGISRSSGLVIAYVMSLGYSFYDAADLVCSKRPIVCPNLGFIKQLQLFEKMNMQLEGDSEHHQQYLKLKENSLAMIERIKQQTEPKLRREEPNVATEQNL
eukprot:TRINITY_DN6291_c0_g1_i2.p1 TRINITY_DN6291_c0_g1~~TRINITY_DN6291_c0_g1_i2.p1  ORF type:complete len:499 (+),score=164.68 TRINITY_DN6291_c0_g1_i2:111-1607(+)